MFKDIPNIPYSNIHGTIESIQPLAKTFIETSVGSLIPVYKIEDQGRKKLTPVKIDSSGKIKSLQLQEATIIKTSVGDLSTEFITFYPDGSVRRLFPLNGKLSGFWSEENEYKLAKKIEIPTAIGSIKVKPIYIHFYKTGELKSITFWPKEKVEITIPIGTLKIKTGISFYKSGKVKSFEPDSEVLIKSPIGNIKAYDPDPVGINGEKNSLSFNENGELQAVSTISTQIAVTNSCGIENLYSPYLQRSMCNDKNFVITPLIIEFKDMEIIFKHGFRTIGKTNLSDFYVLETYTADKPIVEVQSCH